MEQWKPKTEHLPSKIALGAIALGAAAYDVWCPQGETISEGCDRLMSTRLGKLAFHGLIWTTAAHLTNVMPEKYDWLHQLTRLKELT